MTGDGHPVCRAVYTSDVDGLLNALEVHRSSLKPGCWRELVHSTTQPKVQLFEMAQQESRSAYHMSVLPWSDGPSFASASR